LERAVVAERHADPVLLVDRDEVVGVEVAGAAAEIDLVEAGAGRAGRGGGRGRGAGVALDDPARGPAAAAALLAGRSLGDHLRLRLAGLVVAAVLVEVLELVGQPCPADL